MIKQNMFAAPISTFCDASNVSQVIFHTTQLSVAHCSVADVGYHIDGSS